MLTVLVHKCADTSSTADAVPLPLEGKAKAEGGQTLVKRWDAGFEAAARNEGNKKTSPLCYRLYNVYDRIEMDTSRNPVTMQHAVVFTVIQNVADANAYLVTDIKSIAVDKGRIAGKTSKSPQVKGNAHVDTIAQLYEIVKKNELLRRNLL